MYENVSSDRASYDPDMAWYVFVFALCAVTLIPYVLAPFHYPKETTPEQLVLIAGAINFLGGAAHVGSTGFFFFDKRMRCHFLSNSKRFIWAPLFFVFMFSLIFGFSDHLVQSIALLFYFVWQTYHYQRQNFGILSFAASKERSGPVSLLERYALDLSVTAAILALVKHYGLLKNTIFESYADSLFFLGAVIYCFVPVILVMAFWSNPKLNFFSTRALFLFLGCVFLCQLFF